MSKQSNQVQDKQLQWSNQKERRKKLILDSPDTKETVTILPKQQQKIPSSNKLPKHFISGPKKKARLKQQTQEECPICMLNLDDVQNVCEIDVCKHQICSTCIKEWAEKYKTQCPCCRAKFNYIYPIKDGKRENNPIQLNLNLPKWNQEDDEFYEDESDYDDEERCQVCQCSHTPYLMLICDKCNDAFCHTFCDPAQLEFNVPSSKWYCLDCRKSKFIYYKHK
ncbi:unnamed protein product [Paramecium pentaurelia]|uniref:RING-type domain-containing protein n=1 Tax=Paramecium pentaurelia TaxID=43138 RepID=A0A8S1TKB3_9CILI|nr:unnamed protein product [Paramecium pentaurelia]